MQVQVEDVSSVKKKLRIEVPAETVNKELDTAYQELTKTAKIKGFRKGKAPRSVVERLYKKQVHTDISSKLIQDSVTDALKETSIKYVGSPQIEEIPKLNSDQPLVFDAFLDVFPEIGDVDYSGLTLKKTRYEVTEEEIDNQINIFKERFMRYKPVEENRPAEEGDFVLLDHEGFKDSKPFHPTQKAENHIQRLGEGMINKDFDDAIIGMSPGQSKEFTITFPEDHKNEKLRGETVTFHVDLKEIREQILPEIDDEFVQKISEAKTLAEFRENVRKEMQTHYEKLTEQELNEQIYSAMLERVDFEVPEALVEFELQGIRSDVEAQLARYNMNRMDAGFTDEKINNEYHDLAVKQVKRRLILDRVAEQENLTIPEDELEKGLQEMAGIYQQPYEELRKFYDMRPDQFENFRQMLLEKQALRLIIKNSTIEEVEPEENKQEENGGTPKEDTV